MNVFYEHDSGDSLIAKKDGLELNDWICHLRGNGEEMEILLNIAKKLTNGEDMVHRLKEITMENKLLLGVFFRYKNSMINMQECEDMACDIYYINKHEEYRNLYRLMLKSFFKLKEELYAKIVLEI